MRFVCADGRKFKKTVDNVKKCGRKSDFWGWERLSDNPHWEREEATEISTFKSNQIKSFLSSSTNAETQPQVKWIYALPAPACRGPVPETQSLLDTRKYLDNRKYFRQWKYLWWTPLFIKQWMDSVRFILKIVSEREREKLGPVSFWLRPLFASSVIFCESVIAGVLSIQTHPGLLLVSSDHVTGLLRSHWSVLPSCLTVSINWENSTQKYRIAGGRFVIEQWSKILWLIQTCPLWILHHNRIHCLLKSIFLKSLSVSVPFLSVS